MDRQLKDLTLAAMFLALGLILPFLTGQIPQIGSKLLPMHIPVFLCGLICGWRYGALIGFLLPLLRSMVFGMPVFFPSATAMAFELMTYGAVAGALYHISRWQCVRALYRCLITAMLAGRIVWGIVQVIQPGFTNGRFTWQIFVASAFVDAIPGIILQLILIPCIMVALHRSGFVQFQKGEKQTEIK